ncbi:metal-sensitive transcriptional regulator [Levilactobacillus namurensis]|uniref:metal-sensitive transcriptional regulator n=1 Tax=Levilactobacillus namurensis TaxID=380393 RepID=UPI00223178A6|nr:metal-sensitive transcriptional regulator [Levilactobacillus namurensis]MCW3779415.1 metal-sensitive transcriptional regulator [Levilactobacillus namurensis]MDT7017710.1 metal-sensitive transcriptional regulator [Levilactobacillus namurensis]WNN65288.1 metal-sensitive transcriptional regulator [Levilactobacillus namurensis]
MTTTQTQLKNRLRRTDGQLHGIMKMVEDGRECQDILTQLSAVRSSVERIMGVVVAANVQQCVDDVQLSKDQQSELQSALELVIKNH